MAEVEEVGTGSFTVPLGLQAQWMKGSMGSVGKTAGLFLSLPSCLPLWIIYICGVFIGI